MENQPAGGRMRAPKERFDFVHEFLNRVFIDDVHAKRILSLANGALGVMAGAALAVSVIGQALAQARGLLAKSAIKQVDRLLSNAGVVPWELFGSWVREVVGVRREMVVAMDWTDFDADNHATLALHLVTRHGRATPAADDIGRRRRKPRHGSSTANQHRQAPRPFPVPARLPALRSHPQHARGTAAAARRAIRRTPAPKPILLPGVRHRVKMRGYMSIAAGLIVPIVLAAPPAKDLLFCRLFSKPSPEKMELIKTYCDYSAICFQILIAITIGGIAITESAAYTIRSKINVIQASQLAQFDKKQR